MSRPPDGGRPRLWVGPYDDPLVGDALIRAGAELTTPDRATGIVWLDREPGDLGRFLHPGIRWVQLPVSGVESWTADPVLASGPVFTSARGAYAEAVAEHTVALLLAAARQLHVAARRTAWQRLDTRMLGGSTVVIVGAGAIGRELIRMLVPFRCRTVAVNRSGAPVEGADETFPVSSLDDVCASADYLVLAAPATPATVALIGAERLARMPSHSWIVNVGRGTLIDTAALTETLAAGGIAGAALDVTEPEPLPVGHPLWEDPRCLITSHSANPALARRTALAERAAENVGRFARGEPLVSRIDPESGF